MIVEVISWLGVLTIIGLIYRHITRNFNYWKNLNIPYLPPIPLFGNMFKVVALKQSYGQFTQAVYNYTDSRFIGFFVFDQPFLLIRDPDLIKSILIKDFDHFDKRTICRNLRDDKYGSNMLFNMENPEWRKVRINLTPVFTSGKIKSMLDLMLEASHDLQMFISQMIVNTEGRIESADMGLRYTTDVISSCAFGINAHSLKFKNADFAVAAQKLFTFTASRAIQFASYFMAPCLVKPFRMKFLEPNSVEFLQSAFREQILHRETTGEKRGDLIDNLLQIKATNNNVLDGDILVAQAIQFFAAGFETTGSTVVFTLYELAANKEIQSRLRNEILKTLELHGKLTYKAITHMEYLNNVISESLRKYPPLTFLDRRCNKTYKISDSDLTIQEGIPIYISLLGLHMDPAHFPEPERYNPDRFSNENKNSIKPFTYLPFGDGPRNCIGSRFALLNAKAFIIAVITKFEVELDPETPYPISFNPKAGFLIAPKDGVLYLRYKVHTQRIE